MKKIIFIEPKSAHVHVYQKVVFPRLGSVLLGTILKKLGYEVKVFIEEIGKIDFKQVFDSDLVGISTITPTAPGSYQYARMIKDAGIPVVMGGTHVTFQPEEALAYADYVVRGEGEETIVELVQCLEKNGDLSKIKGLSYKDGGKIIHNPPREFIKNLDEIPIPDYSIVNDYKKLGVISVSTSRGCPFNCTFCSVPAFNGKVFRTCSVDRVIEEIDTHLRNLNMNYLFFTDDIFNYNKKRTKEILKRMIENKLTPLWGAQVRHEASRDEEMMELMKKANCDRVFVGFESINPKTLELYNKKECIKNIEDAVKTLHKYRIKVHGMFVLGSDEDNVETIKKTGEFAKKLDIDSVQFMILTPLPGSKFFNSFISENKNFITQDWGVFDGVHAVHQPKKITPYELQIEVYRITKKFYSWASILKRLIIGDVYEAHIKNTARRITKKWIKENNNYIKKLKDDLYSEVKKIVGYHISRKKKSVTIASISKTIDFKNTLETFFKELGIKIVDSKKELANILEEKHTFLKKEKIKKEKILYEYLESLKGKVDFVVIPIVNDFEKYQIRFISDINEVSKSFKSSLSNLPHIINLDVDIEIKSLRETFIKVGLIFTNDLNKIRKAYIKALAVAV